MSQIIELRNKLRSKGLLEDDIKKILEPIEREFNKRICGVVWEPQPEDKVRELQGKFPSLERKEQIFNGEEFINHILFEGENLYALTGMQYTHIDDMQGSIDVIYIDPPYNLCKKDFKYNDTFINPEDQWKHSKWLSFINTRLRLAYNLLKSDGIIMISINEVEQAHLRLLLDEIFGEENLLSTHHIQARFSNKDVGNGNEWLPIMEYVFIYAKDKTKFQLNRPIEDYDISPYVFSIETKKSDGIIQIGNKKVEIFKKGNYILKRHKKCEINLLKEVWGSGTLLKQKNTATWYYNEYLLKRLIDDGVDTLYKIYDIGEDGLGYRYVKAPSKKDKVRGKIYQGVPLEKIQAIKNGENAIKYKPVINYYDYSADFGNIVNEGGVPFNNGKKPIKMLKDLINLHKNKNAVVLDFFAGSGSTAHAVLDLNKEDGGKRQFILCTNNEVDWDTELKYLIDKKYIRKEPKKNTKDHVTWETEINKFLRSSKYKKIKQSEEYQQMGICQKTTLKRLQNIMDKSNSTLKADNKYLNNNLLHYKINLDCEENAIEDVTIKQTIVKFIHYVSIKEKCYEILEETTKYIIFTNKNSAILIYKNPFIEEENVILESKQILDKTCKKILKTYSVCEEKFFLNGIEYIPYPQEIIDKINRAKKVANK